MSGEILRTQIDGFDAEFTSEWHWPPESDTPVHSYRLIVYGDAGELLEHPFNDVEITWRRVLINDRGISEYIGTAANET